MTQKFMALCASLLALLLCAGVFAGGPTPEPTENQFQALSVSISGCETSGTGEFNCLASAFGGSGSYNYWWMHSGTGQLYQTNSPIANITGCIGGSFTLTVQILDRATGQTARSSAYWCSCGEGEGEGEGY